MVAIGGRGDEVGSRAVEGKEEATFLNAVCVCSGCLNLGLKDSN